MKITISIMYIISGTLFFLADNIGLSVACCGMSIWYGYEAERGMRDI